MIYAPARAAFSQIARMPRIEGTAVCLIFVITFVAIAAPALAPADPFLRVGAPFLPPSSQHFMGTDDIGRDLLSRIIYGIGLTWLPSLVVILNGVAIGTLLGTLAGTMGGFIDGLLQRASDLLIVIPSTMIALAAVAALGPGIWHAVAALSVFWWPWYARIVRNEIVAVSTRPHIEAARQAGVKGPRLALRYLLPAALPAVLVTATLDVGNVILVLSLFSFLGLGAPAPTPELGAMTAQSLANLTTHWWIPILPATAIFLLVFIANLAGDGLRSLMKAT